MGERITKRDFFLRPTLEVAQDLLGMYLVRKYKSEILVGRIIETEAYIGPYDRAAHSKYFKITSRNFMEYAQGGFVYIYLVYGMYWQLNITTFKSGTPECVLIRALKPVKGVSVMKKLRKEEREDKLLNGPGKLTQALALDKSFYGEDLIKSKRLWVERKNSLTNRRKIKKFPRVGIDYAGEYWSKINWRFVLEK